MAKKYDYKIFPETKKGWALIIAAGVLGAVLIIGYYVFIFALASPWGVGLFGWWDKIDVQYVNQTDERVLIHLDERLAFTVEAGETVTDEDYKIEWWFGRNVAVFDDTGRVIFADEIDHDELEEMNYRIVIDD